MLAHDTGVTDFWQLCLGIEVKSHSHRVADHVFQTSAPNMSKSPMPERTIRDHREGRLQWSGGSRKSDSIKVGNVLFDSSSEEGGARVPELHDGLGDMDVKAMLGGGAEDRE